MLRTTNLMLAGHCETKIDPCFSFASWTILVAVTGILTALGVDGETGEGAR